MPAHDTKEEGVEDRSASGSPFGSSAEETSSSFLGAGREERSRERNTSLKRYGRQMSGPFYIDASEEIGSSFSSRERKRVATREEEFSPPSPFWSASRETEWEEREENGPIMAESDKSTAKAVGNLDKLYPCLGFPHTHTHTSPRPPHSSNSSPSPSSLVPTNYRPSSPVHLYTPRYTFFFSRFFPNQGRSTNPDIDDRNWSENGSFLASTRRKRIA